MFFSKYKTTSFLIIITLLSACGGGISDVENSHPSQFAPKTAPDLTVKRNENNQLIIDWPEQQNSQEYVLYFSSSENFEPSETLTKIVNKPPYIVEALEAGTNYHVKIIPSWETKTGPESHAVALVAPPVAPNNISIEGTSTISWENDNELFNVYWSKNSNFTINDAEGSIAGIANKNFQPTNNGYQSDDVVYFIITAVNNDVESAVSDKIQILASDLADPIVSPPKNPKVTVSNGTFTMEWASVDSASNYNVYMAQDSGITQTNTTSLTGGMIHPDEQSPFGHGLANGNRYYLVVTAKNSKDEESIESTELSIKPKSTTANVPDNISIEADADHVTINWSAVDNALSYNVYWSTTPDVTAQTGKLVPGGNDTTNTSVMHTGIQNGLMHYYVVTAILSTGESEESAEVGAVPYGLLPQPTNITTQETNNQITIGWPDVPGAAQYHLYMALDNSLTKDNAETLDGGMKHTVSVNSPFIHSGLTNELTYYMRLTAIDKFGKEGIESELIEATPHRLPGFPEVRNPVPDQTTNEDDMFNFQFSELTFFDFEDETLTYSATQHALTNLPDWLSFDANTRTFSGKALNDNVGSIDIDLTATDDDGNSATDTFTLDVININNTPTAKPIPPEVAVVGSNFGYRINPDTFNDIDIGDTLSISATVNNIELPAWINFDSETQIFTGIPALGDIGALTIDVTADDGNGGIVTEPFQLTVRNALDEPFATDDGPIDTNEGKAKTISILDNDLQANSPLNPASLIVTNEPSNGTAFANSDGSIIYTHDGTETTSDNFTYTIKDEDGKISNEAFVNINVLPVNDPPEISGTPINSVKVNEQYNFVPEATDPDNLPTDLTFSYDTLPSWASFDPNTGALSGIPAASDFQTTTTIIISVSDGKLTDSLPPFNIAVTGTPPRANDDSGEIIAAGNSVLIPVLDNDTPNASLDRSSIEITKTPANGTATPDGNGNILYQSTGTIDSSDSFGYTVKDNIGLVSNEATVTISTTLWTSMDIPDTATTGIAGVFKEEIPGTYTVSGAGEDIWSTADSFHFAYKPIVGDIDISTRVTEITNPAKWIKAGIMIRETLDADSRHVNLFATDISLVPDDKRGINLHGRIETNQLSNNFTSRFNGSQAPQYIRLKRRGNTFNAFESVDGVDWQIIGTINIPMTQAVYVGFAITSRRTDQLSTATFDNLSLINKDNISPTTNEIKLDFNENPTLSNLPLDGRVNNNSRFYRIIGLTAENTYNVNITSSTADEDMNLQVFRDPWSDLECQSFLSNVNYDACLATANSSGQLYVRVDGSYTTSQTNFTLDLTSWEPGIDIGTQTEGYNFETDGIYPTNDQYIVAGSGKDIWETSDGFRYLYQPISGDVEIIAHVASQVASFALAKAGVMIRESLQTDAKFVDVVKTRDIGVRFQMRDTTGGVAGGKNSQVDKTAYLKRWVRLVKRGNAFDGYESANGTKWLFLGTANIPDFQTENFLVGLAVTAHDASDTEFSEVTFENVEVYNSSGKAIAPETLTGPIANPQTTPFHVDTTDKFFRITNLTASLDYEVTLAGLTDNADIYVYEDALFSSGVCGPTADSDGTQSETCLVPANADGELFIRINGSYTNNGSDFVLTVK